MQVPSVLPTTKTSFFDDETVKLGAKVWADTTHYPNRKLSRNIILEGILFRKSNKNPVFMKSCYYILYDDRLVYYNNVREKKEKGFVLLETLKIDILDTNDTSKESNYGIRLIFNMKYEDIYCRSRETFDIWLEKLRPKCIFKDFAHNFGCQKVIGKGSFAKVYLAHRLDDKTEFAIKSFDKRGLEANDKNKQSLLLEISIMRILNHPNILKVYEVYETDNHINLVLEILRGGELFERIVSRGSYSERDAAVLMKNLLSALEHLHSHGIMHRDIKPENLILATKDDDKNIKLADFGLASYVGMTQQLFTRCGTPGYVAPEVLDDLPYNEKVDIFSAGIIMYILLTGSSPFYGKSYNEILMKNKKCKISYDFTEFKHKPSAPALCLLKKMLEKNHNERISATEALQHEWIVSEGGRHDSVDVGVDTGIANIPASALDNMKRFQEESKGLFNMTRLKPKEMFDDSKLVMKPGLITGRTDTLEESKIIGPESPSFVPKPLRKMPAGGAEDLRKMAILKHAETSLVPGLPEAEPKKPEKATQETKEGEAEGEGEDNDDDETDSFIGDEEESYSLRSNLEKLNGELNNIRIQNDLVALSEKFTSPLSQKRMPMVTQSKKGLDDVRFSLMNLEKGPLMKKNTTT